MLFGNAQRIEYEMPQCLLRVGRFSGRDGREILDNRQFHGNAFVRFQTARRFLRETLPIGGRILKNRAERIDEPLVSALATREALANALCHRDFSIGGGSGGVAVCEDRLEMKTASRYRRPANCISG